MKKILSLFMLLIPIISFANPNCNSLASVCHDKTATKEFAGVKYKLKDVCRAKGINPDSPQCCWEQENSYMCGDNTDTCKTYRNSNNCKFIQNTCAETDPLSGICKRFNSSYECASNFAQVESTICTDAVCANYANDTASTKSSHSCTPSPWGTDCQQWASAGCTLTHQGSCLNPTSSAVKTCNPWNPGECDVYDKNPSCKITKQATCDDVAYTTQTCTIETNPLNNNPVNDGCQTGGYYDTSKWKPNGTSGVEYVCGALNPAQPSDGTVLATGYNQDASKTQCSVSATITSNSAQTKNGLVSVSVTTRNDDYPYNEPSTFNISMNVGSHNYVSQHWNNGDTDKTVGGNIQNASCNGNNCTMTFVTTCSHHQLGGNDWDRSTAVTLNYVKPIAAFQDMCQDYIYQSLNDTTCGSAPKQNMLGANGYSPREYTCSTGDCSQYDFSVYTCEANASQCVLPNGSLEDQIRNKNKNVGDFAQVLGFLELGKQAADDMSINCSTGGSAAAPDPSTCKIFSGKYFRCHLFNADNWFNNGADCGTQSSYFSYNSIGKQASDKSVYASVGTNQVGTGNGNSVTFNAASGGQDYKLGDQFTYKLTSSDNPAVINKEADKKLEQEYSLSDKYTSPTTFNKDATGANVSLSGGKITQVSLSNKAGDTGFFNDYLTPDSVKLAWNKLKSSADPRNPTITTFSQMGVTRAMPGGVNNWSSEPPYRVQGLCMHLANTCLGGNDKGTDWVRSFSFGQSPNACGACTNEDPIWGNCLTADSKTVVQEWCCFDSKLALAMTVAAYDQGLINLYNGSTNKYAQNGNVAQSGNMCGGLTIKQLAQIDFSKADYFADFKSSINTENFNQYVNVKPVQDQSAQSKVKSIDSSTANAIVNNNSRQ